MMNQSIPAPRTTIDAIDDAIDAIDTQLDNAMIEYANADIDAIDAYSTLIMISQLLNCNLNDALHNPHFIALMKSSQSNPDCTIAILQKIADSNDSIDALKLIIKNFLIN